jgi:TonB-dependent starch-binding outer membrane protein SusC
MKTKIVISLFIAAFSFLGLNGQKSSKKITISGYVTDQTQNPVANAIVMIDGEKTKYVTDNKGYYKIKVESGCTKIGILTFTNGLKEEAINGRNTINFIFEGSVPDKKSEVSAQSDETVDIGYGTIKKKDATTQVSKKTKTKDYSSYRTIYDLIRGELPGVQVSGTSIKIQGGVTSFSLSSEPLFVVDEVPVNSIDYINPNMVKSISVLKGSSAAIYGSRGTNGVILINLIGPDDKN